MPDRCPTCDREGCPKLLPAEHTEECRSDCPRCAAIDDCRDHRVDWRDRALAAEAEADGLAKASLAFGIVLDKLGARDTGTGGQTVEAGNARIVHDGMRRLDRAIADAARWRKVAPLIEALHQASMIEAGDPMHVVDAAMELLAATQEPTP